MILMREAVVEDMVTSAIDNEDIVVVDGANIVQNEKKLVWFGFERNTRTFICRLTDKKVGRMKEAAQVILEEKKSRSRN